MIFNNRKSLGLAVSERGLTAALVAPAAGKRLLLNTVSLDFTAELNLANPEKLGRELKRLLRQEGISASRCVIGLAASYAVTREKTLPAAEDAVIRGAIALAAERDFASGDELLFDYCSWPSPKGVTALVAAAPARVIEQVTAMARAAGLAPAAVTLTALALAAGMAAGAGRLVLCLHEGGAELVVQSGEAMAAVRPVAGVAGNWPNDAAAVAMELKRTLASLPGDAKPQLVAWDATGSSRPLAATLEHQVGLPVHSGSLETDLGLAAAGGAGAAGRFVPAAACAASKPTIDFLHPRLAAPKARRLGPWARWGAIAAAMVLVAGLWLVLDWRSTAQDVLDMQGRLSKMAGEVHEANALVDNIAYARTWYDRRPEFLACLQEVTRAFPVEGRIWATSLLVHEDMQVLLTGQGSSESAVLEVRDKLKANSRLANVKQLYIRQSDGATRDVSFAISLSLRRTD